jgi:hypothetical protein
MLLHVPVAALRHAFDERLTKFASKVPIGLVQREQFPRGAQSVRQISPHDDSTRLMI